MSGDEKLDPRVLERADHNISRQNISENTLKVLYRLHKAGKKAYLVGGAVRDLLLDRAPKDFDVGTDAKPNEARRLFRNSRIIGRRFRLVHVYFQDGIVELATFRREPDPEEQAGSDDELLITSDNTWGTPRQDAFRRDFTINALFYDISDFSVIDYVGGIDDLEDGVVRAIGDPVVRFREDPVRMVRACEFAARLGFRIEEGTAEGIRECHDELAKAAPARVTEEILQLLQCGAASDAFQLMFELDLLEDLVPEAYAMVEAQERELGEFNRFPQVFDDLVAEGRELSHVALLAALLLPELLVRRFDREAERSKPLTRRALEALVRDVCEPFFTRLSLARAKSEGVLDALDTFLRMCEPGLDEGRRKQLAMRSRGFEDALLVFEILTRATGEGDKALTEWRQAAKARPKGSRGSGSEPSGKGGSKGRRGRRRRRSRKRRG